MINNHLGARFSDFHDQIFFELPLFLIFSPVFICSHFVLNENACVMHHTRVDGVENSLKNFDFGTVTLTYDPDPCDL